MAASVAFVLWGILLVNHQTQAYNILVFPVHLPSREPFYEFIQTHLNYADHNVSFLIYKSDTRSLTIQPPSQTVIIDDEDPSHISLSPRQILESWEEDSLSKVGTWREDKHLSIPDIFRTQLADRCNKLFEDTNLLRALKQMKPHLILVDLYGNDICGIILGKKLKAVVAGFITDRLIEPFAYKISAPFHPSYISLTGSNLDYLFDRLANFYHYIKLLSSWDSAYFDVAAQSVCSHSDKCLSAQEVYRDLSLLLINSDLTLEPTARPLPPNTAFLAGLHCQISALLPHDLDSIARSFRSGIIYVSFITALNDSKYPKQLVDVIIEGLGGLPYAIFWKTSYQRPNDSSHPNNVFMQDTFSMQDVLGHGRTRLVISLCDSSSVISAVYHGVPLICLPLSEEQLFTARTVVVPRGLGVLLTLDKLSAANLGKAAKEVISNKSYRLKSRLQGDLLRDKPETSSDRLVYWVEYAVRRNATSLRVLATEIGLFKYLFLDAVLLLTFILSAVVSVAVCIAKVTRYRINVNKIKVTKSD